MIRTCVVCGKKITIKLGEGGKYDNGHYFGVIDVPFGKGEWKKVGTTKLLGGKHNVVKWTGKRKKVEYWECNRCFKESG